jgi:hypothetical protein
MDLQGKDPDEMTAVQVVQFFEQIEESEDFIPDSKSGNNKGNGKKSKSNGKDNNGGKTKKVCMIHGECGHTTDECRTVQSKVNKRSRTNDDKDDRKSGSKNKTWSCKADDNKKKAKNDLNAIIQEAVQKEVNALTEAGILKRKSDSESSDSEPDSDGEEMNCVEQRMKKVDIDAIDLNNFDLDELKEHAKSKMD